MPADTPPVVLRLTVRNHPGVLSHVSGLFARRAFNVEGVLCVPVGDGSRSVVLLLVPEDRRLEQVVAQLRKLEDVLEVRPEPEGAAAFAAVARHVRPRRFTPGRIAYDGSMSASFGAARALSEETARSWRVALAPWLGTGVGRRLLDLGAGVGRFAPRLAAWFGVEVIAVEPAAAMRAVAERDPRVTWLGGRGEAIPLRHGSVDVVWLSHVLHHVADPGRCAREVGRVLLPEGRVLLRGTFPDRPGRCTLFEFFPEARDVLEDFPTFAETIATFCAAGFDLERVQRIAQQASPNLHELAARARLRADTSLALLTDEEFARGLAALDRRAADETEPVPAVETVDLLVFRRLP